MLTREQINLAAARLDQAEKTRIQTRQLSLEYPELTMGDAYAIQSAWVEQKLNRGSTIKGHKIGLTSRAMQSAMNIDTPDSGTLLEEMFFADGSGIPFERFIVPMVEVELAFVLAKRLEGEKVSLFEVLSATDYVTPVIEIIDARIHRVDPQTKVSRKVLDTISDNAANAGVVLGGRPIRPMDADLRWVAALLYRNGVLEETGVAAGVLNHPANGIAWLCQRLAPLGVGLEPGQIILAGSFTRPLAAKKGDVFHADYGPLGGIGFSFV
jgi:2-oxo-hept-3-ene-1,7-dioate hydratase